MADFDITRIAGNIGAMNALNSLQNINKQLSIHQTRLSTGKRINSAADDPAGLTIATKMNSRAEGLKTALDNIGDAKNLLSVAESGLGRINDILVQMQNKSESAASDTMGSAERDAIVTQLTAYSAQIDDISAQTQWNGKNLIDGTTGTLSFQTGAGKDDVTDVELTEQYVGHRHRFLEPGCQSVCGWCVQFRRRCNQGDVCHRTNIRGCFER